MKFHPFPRVLSHIFAHGLFLNFTLSTYLLNGRDSRKGNWLQYLHTLSILLDLIEFATICSMGQISEDQGGLDRVLAGLATVRCRGRLLISMFLGTQNAEER